VPENSLRVSRFKREPYKKHGSYLSGLLKSMTYTQYHKTGKVAKNAKFPMQTYCQPLQFAMDNKQV
jgi:hypothetical protein